MAKLRRDRATLDAVRGELEEARVRCVSWKYDSEGFEALQPGLQRLYRRGRRSMRAAVVEPSDEHFHEWRKRAKDLWHALQILRPAAPKRMKARADRAHRLSDLLGDDHDLALLREHVAKTAFPAEQEATRTALLSVIDRRRGSLQREALKLGARVYGRLAEAVCPLGRAALAEASSEAARADRRLNRGTRVAAGHEIERKFLVLAIPANPGPGTRILQGYLPLASDDTELRVRRKGDETVLTVKRGRGLDRGEQEVAISAEAFETLWPLTEGRRIEKTRYELPHGDVTIELDEFGGEPEGLLVAEVEFDSPVASEVFEEPGWLGRDVTDDPAYANRALAGDPAERQPFGLVEVTR